MSNRFRDSAALVVLIAVFAYGVFKLSEGYFPRPILLQGFANHSEQRDDISYRLEEAGEGKKRTLGKVIMVVIDALRNDFAVGAESAMEFVKRTINASSALSWAAYAHPPTVTLPRIKALTTGSVPSFLDVLMNFASEELKADNLLTQLNQMNKSIGMYFVKPLHPAAK
jgi:ethanolaminephosphotransferase